MKYLIATMLIVSVLMVANVSRSAEAENTEKLQTGCEVCQNNLMAYINQSTESDSRNLIITRSRSEHRSVNIKPDIGLLLIKNNDHIGIGIGIVKPLYKLF